MSNLDLLIDTYNGRLTAAVTKHQKLHDLYVDSVDRTAGWASLYVGKVIKIDRRLDAAIVDLGQGLSGFLPAKHVQKNGHDKIRNIADILKAGEIIKVQIKCEGKRQTLLENNKLPRLTMKIRAIGQYLNYNPLSQEVLIPKDADSTSVEKIISALKAKGGWVLQKNACNAAADHIIFEADQLKKEWQETEKLIRDGGDTPRLIKQGLNAIEQVLQDYGSLSFAHIYCADKKILDFITAWCARHQPDLATSKRLRLFKPEKPGQKLFDQDDVAAEIEDLSQSCVSFTDGGSIIIEPTHALTVIDVNQGAGEAINVNETAAHEIARQIRLRNISGAILVDFINMTQKTDRARLIDCCKEALNNDAAGAEIHGFTRLGIIEITRKRRSASLVEKNSY